MREADVLIIGSEGAGARAAMAAADAGAQDRRHSRGRKKPGEAGLLTHGTLTHGIRRIGRVNAPAIDR